MIYERALRSKTYVKDLTTKIARLGIGRKVKVMEVCGTHTYAFFRFGLRSLLSPYVDFISGPGCPVCITGAEYLDTAVHLAQDKKNIITTFGDLMRVRGSKYSLEDMRALGKDVRIVYSPVDALALAHKYPKRKVVFLSIGFETTVPLAALTVRRAKEEGLKNFFVLCGNHLIPPAMHLLCEDESNVIEGFLCPGHVSAIIGSRPYRDIVKRFGKGCVVSGFEPVDIAFSLYILLQQVKDNKPALVNNYTRVVKDRGNRRAQEIIKEVFAVGDASWRGLGTMKKSGLFLRGPYKKFCATQLVRKKIISRADRTGCLCGEVIKGKCKPPQCCFFGKQCSPANPLGPCMVSQEGACRIYHEYRSRPWPQA